MATISVAGYLSADSDLRFSDKGVAILKFSIPEKDKDGKTTWFSCAVLGKRGEATAQYMKKGTIASVVGIFNIREYERNDGTKGSSNDILVSDFKFFNPRQNPESEVSAEVPF